MVTLKEFVDGNRQTTSHLRLDSREVLPGDIFVALKGKNFDGHDHALQALEKGAVAIVSERSIALGNKIPTLKDAQLKQKLPALSAYFYGSPANKLYLVGITGTNGKTTCAYLLQQAWKKMGKSSGYIGTLGAIFNDKVETQLNTTPDPVRLHAKLKQMVDAGITHVSIECSAQGMAQGRLKEVDFDQMLFTNFSQDHLDDFGSMEIYFKTKWRGFEYLVKQSSKKCTPILNKNILDEFKKYSVAPSIDFQLLGKEEACYYKILEMKSNVNGLGINLNYGGETLSFKSSLRARYNGENLASVAALLHGSFETSKIETTLASLPNVPGRLEQVENTYGKHIFIDYAHTADALEKALEAVTPETKKQKLWCVFGCGGDRDRSKRPIMLKAVQSYADEVVITADNPRTEAFEAIVKDMLGHFNIAAAKEHIHILEDRHEAIVFAIAQMGKGDTLLIAGKGEEAYQMYGHEKKPHSDRKSAEAAFVKE